ncbi:MAG TPA: 23S rRNA (uracil(1939)-C(5))-methyltransferase RlmD [Steroidobacteraceae bacterium]
MSRRSAVLDVGSETGVVAALSQEGEGIVRGGKTAFIAGALPGETVRFRRVRRHRQFDDARLEEIIAPGPAPSRVQPRCAHFQICGGCALQHLDSGAQLRLKQQQLADSLERLARLTPQRWLEPIGGEPWNYRRRARLGVKYVARKGRVLVGFRERASNLVADLERCEVLAPPMDGLIAPLAALIGELSIRELLPQIEVSIGDGVAALVLRVLQSPTEQDCTRLREFEARYGVRLFLQSGGLDSVRALTEPAPRLFYALPAGVELEFGPTDFIQINAEVNRALVAAAAQLLELDPGSRVLDLYCGLGNFSLALARLGGSVVGVEGEAALVERARANARRNRIDNAQFFQADLSGADVAGAPWLQGGLTHVLLDPPRLGAQAMLPRIAQLAPQRLLYVSCHPGTLARDLGTLVHEHGFELLAAGVVDMFAHTAHVESVALLAPRARPGAAGGGGHGRRD